MEKHLSFLLLGILFALCPYAQNGVIAGRVIDGDNGLSLPGATVKIEKSNRYTFSEENGNFEFLNIPEGTYAVYVEYLGYKKSVQKVSVKSQQTTTIDFKIYAGSDALEDLIVVGNALKGQAKALNVQKNSGNITNVISSDQVGRFPDANIGDALKRVPGITMQNDQGEARDIIIRGLSPELNAVTLNGDRIPSAEGDNRNVQMDLIPSDMVASIEVNKTLTPDMDGDAIGGSVNLITRATPNKQRLSATIAGGYAPIRQKPLYNTSLIYGNRFFNNKLGVVTSASWHVQNFGSDNIEAVWIKDKGDKVYISQMDIRKYDVQRIRRSFSFSTDYAFDKNNHIDFSAMYNWRDDRENRFRLRYKDISLKKDGTYEAKDVRRETKGGINSDRNQNRRLEDQRVLSFALKGEHLLSPKLDMRWKANYSKASEDRPNERYIDFAQKKVAVSEDLTNERKPFVSFLGEEKMANFNLRKLSENHNFTKEDEFGSRIDFRIPLSVIQEEKGRLRFGLRMRLKNKMRDNIFYEYKPKASLGSLADIPNVYLNDKNFNPGSEYVAGVFPQSTYLGGLDMSNLTLFDKKLSPAEFLSANYKAQEQILAGYLRWDQDLSRKTKLITGVRLEQTNIKYTGNYVIDEKTLQQEIQTSNKYLNVLPGISLKHEFNKNFILRTAITTGLARPNYYQLAPYVNAIADGSELKAGNPNLKVTYGTNFDVMLENYFENIGIISGGAFYKNLKNFIYVYRNNRFNTDNFAALFPNLPNPINAGTEWTFTQARNGEAVSVYGFEFAVQRQLDFIPGNFFKNLGIYANYTYTGSKAKGITNEAGEFREGLGLPKTAPHMVNGSLFWENKKLTVRLSANYTSAYLDEVGGTAFDDTYYDEQLFLDFNVSYRIKKQWNIFAEANNLTNQPLRYYQGEKNRVKQLEYYQSKFNLGVKFDL